MTEDEKRRMDREAHEERPEEQQDESAVEDLDVPDDKSRDVKGGGNTKWGNIEL